MLMKLPSFQRLFRDARSTFDRFPLVIIDAIIGTIAALILIDNEGKSGPTVFFNILFAAILGFPFFMSVALLSEKKMFSSLKSLSVNLIVLLLLITYAFSVPSDLSEAPAIYTIRLLILAVALYLFVTVAPFIGAGEVNGFWHYNKILFLRLITSALYSVVLYVGFSLAVAALDNLFGIDIPGKRYGELAILIYGVFTTWFFLAGIPENLDSLNVSTDYPKGLKIFAQYILLSIASVYLVILYAFLGKILFSWEWPQGWVSKLILGFSATGMFTILFLYPIRNNTENRWITMASKWFYFIMIPLIMMFFPAVWRRISEYGFTEGRYIAIALGVWLTAMIFYFIFSKTKNIKIIPGLLCVSALMIAFGPLGVFDVSEKSQVEILKLLLEKNSILVDGAIRKAGASVPYEDAKRISSIITYLHNIHGYDRIQSWFDESLIQDSVQRRLIYKSPVLVTRMMGIEYVRVRYSSSENETVLDADPADIMDTEGYNRLIRTQYVNEYRTKVDFENQEITFRTNNGLDTLIFNLIDNGMVIDSVKLELNQLVRKLLSDYNNVSVGNVPSEKMSVTNASQSMRIKVYLQHIRIRRDDNGLKLIGYEANILYKIEKVAIFPQTLH